MYGICGDVYDCLDNETHATDKTLHIYKYGNITNKPQRLKLYAYQMDSMMDISTKQ